MDEHGTIFRLNDDISFRKCSLFDGSKSTYGDCTSFTEKEENWRPAFYCDCNGIHLHCSRHPEIELNMERDYGAVKLRCPKCRNEISVGNYHELISQCLRMLNMEKFKGATLIRLDDWYIPEIKEKTKHESGYWIQADVKTDKDGDTIIVLYVGHKDSAEKAQYFIKPEKLQLTSDHKDMDPAKVLSEITVRLRNRSLKQEYD